MSEIKVAFHDMGSDDWMGGRIFVENALQSLSVESEDSPVRLRCFLLKQNNAAGAGQQKENVYRGAGNNIIGYERPTGRSLAWLTNSFCRKFFHHDLILDKVLETHDIEVLFGPILKYRNPGVIKLSYLPDFQHLHFPSFFSGKELAERNRNFLLSAKLSDRVVLQSEGVKRDFEAFASEYSEKSRVLKPVSIIPRGIYDLDPNEILRSYDLPDKFFYLPNQFWKHKNHGLVFEAVKRLGENGISTNLICTGQNNDYRYPGYFDDLSCMLSDYGLQDRVRYLGLIPRQDVFQLIRQCICLINPSLLEGWGFTVDEARSIGKRVLASDIPAHREQNPPSSIYFNPYDCDDLADKMLKIWNESVPGPDHRLEEAAIKETNVRIREYRDTFLSIVGEACEEQR